MFKESKRISRRPCDSSGGICKGNREVVLTYRVDVLKRNYFRVCVLDILIPPPRITVRGDRRLWPHLLSQHVVPPLVDCEEKKMADEIAEGVRSSRRRKV